MDHIGIAKRHTLIIESLRSGDPEQAEAVMREHIMNSFKAMLEKLEKEQAQENEGSE